MSLCLQGIEELNRQIRLFKQNYLVVEVESLLLDTATKLEWIVRQGITVNLIVLETVCVVSLGSSLYGRGGVSY